MPVPLLPLAIALTAGSALANQYGQNKVDKARARALERDLAQRAAHEKRSAVAADTTLEQLASTAARETGRTKELAAKAKANQVPLAPAVPGAGLTEVGVSPRIIETIRADRAGTRGFADAQADDRAKLAAFGDIMLGNQIEAGRAGQDIHQSGVAANNWTNQVLPAQLGAANVAGQSAFTLGDIMGLAASFMWPGALAGPGLAGQGAVTGAKALSKRNYVDLSTQRPPPYARV